MSKLPEYVSERVFDASREKVWSAWTDSALLSEWYGPGVETVIHELNVREGGTWLNEMRMRGMSMFSKATYQEVSPPEKLVFIMDTTDGDWTPIPNPMMADWPTLLTIVTFEDIGGKTKQTLTWIPHEASEAQITCFANAVENMGKGWGAGFDILAGLVERD